MPNTETLGLIAVLVVIVLLLAFISRKSSQKTSRSSRSGLLGGSGEDTSKCWDMCSGYSAWDVLELGAEAASGDTEDKCYLSLASKAVFGSMDDCLDYCVDTYECQQP